MKFSRKNNSATPEIGTHHRWSTKITCQLLFITLILATIPAVLGADFWEKKAYSEWKERECIKMLTDSPWAKNYSENNRSSNADDTIDGNIPFIKYTVRLNSALPLRQATIRMAQIANKYDDLSDEQKQAFDNSANPYLATAFTDIILVHVEYSTNQRTQQVPLRNFWQIQTTEVLKNSTYLFGSDDVKVQLLEYVPPQEGQTSFQFIFPRMYEGQPIVTAEDKSLKLEFDTMSGDRAFIDFKVKKMILDGEVIY